MKQTSEQCFSGKTKSACQNAATFDKKNFFTQIVTYACFAPSHSIIENLINKGGFQVKGWIFSDDPMNQDKTAITSEPNTSTEKVLRIIWNPVKDYLCFEVNLNFLCKKHKLCVKTDSKTNPLPYEIPEQLTKRIILSQVNSIYDPLGLSGPFTVRAKIMMRQIWASDIKMKWDDPIPEENKQDCIMFFKELHEMDNIKCDCPQDFG